MTRKHFRALALAMAQAQPFGQGLAAANAWTTCCIELADACAQFNDNFDRFKFLEACGKVEQEQAA